jgi:hypothetical protein
MFLVLTVSILGLVWVNTGNHEEYGYLSCGDSSIFFPANSIDPNNPGGPCYGKPVFKYFAGRYEDRVFIDEILSVIICLGGAAYILLI